MFGCLSCHPLLLFPLRGELRMLSGLLRVLCRMLLKKRLIIRKKRHDASSSSFPHGHLASTIKRTSILARLWIPLVVARPKSPGKKKEKKKYKDTKWALF